jgi:hypothetical protein
MVMEPKFLRLAFGPLNSSMPPSMSRRLWDETVRSCS